MRGMSRLKTIWPVLALLLLSWGWSIPVAAQAPDQQPSLDLNTGWQYRWEPWPVTADGSRAWLLEPLDSPNWQPLPDIDRLPVQPETRILWMRTVLPRIQWRDPTLFFDSVDQGTEVYLDDTLIYRNGLVEHIGTELAIATTHHMVHLPDDYQGRVLTLRFYSQYNTIGPRPGIYLGSHAQHLLHILKTDIDRFILGCLLLVISLAALILTIRDTRQPAYFGLALFSATAGLFIIFRTQLIELFTTNIFLQEYTKLSSIFLLPVGLAIFFEHTITAGPYKIIRRIWQVHLAYAVGAIGLSLLGAVQPLQMVLPFEVLATISLLLMVIISVREAWRGNVEARLFVMGYGLLLLFASLEIADDLGWLVFPHRVIHWGIFSFVIMLMMIMVRRFYQAADSRSRLVAIERELSLARQIQQNLLPPARPEWAAPNVECFSAPAQTTGGDLYTYHAFDDRHFAVVVGDASGKGLPAALLMSLSMSSVQAVIGQALPPAELLVTLDQAIGRYSRAVWQNCALCYVELTLTPGQECAARVRTANAGCIPPLIRRQNGSVEWVNVGGTPLGLGLSQNHGYSEAEICLMPGDLIILTSDGVVEAHNGDRTMFGFERLERAVSAGPTTTAADMLLHLKRTVTRFVGSTDPHDDITIVVAQV